jgi:hypothetical protein
MQLSQIKIVLAGIEIGIPAQEWKGIKRLALINPPSKPTVNSSDFGILPHKEILSF